MAVFYSFHYDRDSRRVQQVENMGALEGQKLLNSQEWETIKRGGDKAIENWIAEQMLYKTAVVVLVGAETAGRRWVKHEIIKAWNDKRPLVGVRIHGLADPQHGTDSPGANPFAAVGFKGGGSLADYITLHSPAGSNGSEVHASIAANLPTWVAGAYKRS